MSGCYTSFKAAVGLPEGVIPRLLNQDQSTRLPDREWDTGGGATELSLDERGTRVALNPGASWSARRVAERGSGTGETFAGSFLKSFEPTFLTGPETTGKDSSPIAHTVQENMVVAAVRTRLAT